MPGLAGEVANLIVALKLDDSGFSGKLNSIAGRLKGMDAGLHQMGRGVGQVGAGLVRLGTAAGVAAAGGLTAVVTTAASFEQAFTGVEKTVDGTDAQLAKLEEQFRSMARTIPVSFEELAGIGEAGGALGIAREDLLEFTDVVARLGVSTNLSSDQAATALGQLGNVLHLSGDDFRDLADSLVALGNDGASTESQIVDMAARFAAAGNSAGLTKEEILALSSAVASMGIEVEAGGSSLSRIFNNVATNIGTSSEKAVAFADTLGLSAAEFRTAWERDALGTFQNFLRELGKLDQFEQASVLKDIGITNTRDISAVRLMSQNIGLVAGQLKVANTAQGALNKESQKFFDTTAGQWQKLKNNIRDAGVTIGNEVLPVTTELIQEFTTWLNTPEMRTGLKNFGQDLADGIRGVVTELKGTDFSGLIGGMKLAAEVAKGAFNAFRSLPEPIQQLAIAALVANKVSGGAVGLIAKGLGNIALGGAKTFLGLRGASAANPVYTREVGLGGAGGGLAGGGKWGWIGNALKVTVIGAVAIEGLKTAFDVSGLFDPKHRDPETGRPFRGTNVPEERMAQLLSVAETLRQRAAEGDAFAAKQLIAIEAAIKALQVEMAGTSPVKVTNPKDFKKDFDPKLLEETKAARLAIVHGGDATAAALKELTLEQRLLRDKGFKTKVDAKEFIDILRRTSEFGRKGEGTTIEQGPRTGRDPFGASFVALVKRLEKPALESVVVQGEISRHIVAAEEAQVRALHKGDREAAVKLQKTIDALHRIQGTEDRHRAVDERGHRNTENATRGSGRDVANKVNEASRAIGASRQAVLDMGGRQVGYLSSINAKDFSPTVNVNTSTTVNVLTAAGLLIQQTRIEQAIAGTGQAAPPGMM